MTDTVMVRVSIPSMLQQFNGCEPDYIRDICHGACCKSSTTAARQPILEAERAGVMSQGGVVRAGWLLPMAETGRCRFQDGDSHLCGLHGTAFKPFGCSTSPFYLNKNDLLVVRNRFRRLKCFKDGRRLPAYVAFRGSLKALFLGPPFVEEEIVQAIEHGDRRIEFPMPWSSYVSLKEIDVIKETA